MPLAVSHDKEVTQPPAGIRFDRNEWSGAFGDIGTDFPLIVGMILAAGLDPASVLLVFGAMQILTGLTYRMPMPAQPLKAMAVLVISQNVSAGVLYGGGLAIGVIMLLLSVTGLIEALARAVPKTVIRGIQFGLGMQLSVLALTQYLPAEGWEGYGLAAAAFALILIFIGNRRFPPGPVVILLGIVYAVLFRESTGLTTEMFGFHLPHPHLPTPADIWTGLVVLALPQIPLSLGNSILATKQICEDLFPGRRVTVRKISLTYAAMNLLNPFLSGIPTCHGSGGMAGHYAFGGRTGGSVVLYGSFYVVLGLLFSGAFEEIIHLFPRPLLGVILLFEALALITLIRDVADVKSDLVLVALIGLLAANLPYGYVIALVLGVILARFAKARFAGLTR